MFDRLSDKLGSVLDKIRGRGALTEADVLGDGLVGEVEFQRIAGVVGLRIVDDEVASVVEVQLGLSSFDGALPVDSADLPCGFVG